jgi:peptide/nickel transport system substrate-binding protein
MPPFRLSRLAGLTAFAWALTACAGTDQANTDGATGGTLIIAVPAEPATLLPPLVSGTQGFPIVNALFDRLAEIGPALETYGDAGYTPRLASSWRWSADSLSIAFALDSMARWHDGQPVRADDVRYTFRVYTSDSLAVDAKSLLGNIDSVSVRDARTAVFWFKRRMPRQFYDATYHMYILPAHLLDTIPMAALDSAAFGRRPVGTGRFRFARWEPGQRIEIVADTANARGRALLDRVVWTLAPDFGAATVKLFAGEADLLENLRPDNLAQVAQTPALRLIDNRTLQYGFLGFNLRDTTNAARPHPLFGDARVRRALHMAVDRDRLVRNVFDSLGMTALAPAPRALIPDTTAFRQLPYNVAMAKALLDSAGWVDHDNDGVRDRDGVRLSFRMLIPASSTSRQRYAVLLQEQYRAIGVDAAPQQLENNAWSEAVDAHHFDAYLGGWQTNPGLVGLKQTWAATGVSNAGRYASAPFDALLDSALTTFDPRASRGYWARAFQEIVNDVPAIWLYEQRSPLAVHRRVITTPLRADGWYAGLADWRIDPAQRLDRDRIGLGTPP